MPIRLDELLKSQGLTEADVVVTGQPMQPRESAAPQRGIPLDQLLAQSAKVSAPQPQKPTKLELIAEAYNRGILPEDKRPLYEEAVRRGLINPPAPSQVQSDPPMADFLSDDQMSRMGGDAPDFIPDTPAVAQGGQPMPIIWDDQKSKQPAGLQQSRIVWDDEPGALLHQQVQQIAKMTEGDWLAKANAEIDWRERGVTLEKIDNGDGTFTYQQRQTTPQKLSNSEKQAIYDTYRRLYSYGSDRNQPEFGQATRENLAQIQNQFARQDQAEAQSQGAVRNFLKATTNTVAQLPAGIVDAVSGFANRINRNQGLNEYAPGTLSDAINQQYNYNPESVSGFAGMVTGNAIPMLPGVGSAAMGAKATAETLGRAYLGAGAMSQFGNVVADVAKRRAAGENISDAQMYSAAFLSAAAEVLGEKLGLDAITDAVANPAIRKSLVNRSMALLKSAGVNATEEGVTQVMQNAVTKGLIDPNQMLTEGVETAMAAGGVTGAAVPLVGRGIGRMGVKTETAAVNGETAVSPKEAVPFEAQATAPTAEKPSALPSAPTPPEALEVQRLPEVPPESKDWSFNELKDWAKSVGYDVAETTFRRQLSQAISDQRQAQTPTPAKFTPAAEITPQGRNGMGNLVDPNTKVEWTDAKGETVQGVYASREMNGDHWVYDTQGQQHRVKTADMRVLTDQGTPTLEQQAKPPIPPEARDWSFTELKEWAKENGYQVGQAHNLDSVRKFVADQRGNSMTELPHLPKEAALWGSRRLKWWAEQNGYKVSEATTPKEMKATIRQQRAASIAVAKEDLQALKRGPEAVKALKGRRENPPGAPVERDYSERVADAYQDAAEKARLSAAKAAPPEGTSHKRRVPTTVEEWITPISSRIRDISAPIYNRLMRMEFDTGVKRERIKRELQTAATTLSEALGGKDSDKYQSFKTAVLNQDFKAARALLPAEAHAAFDTFAQTFEGLIGEMQGAGVSIGRIENYWPRFLKDYKAFDAEFGNDKGRFEEAWELAKAVKGRRLLTAEEKAEIANNVLQGYGPRKPGSYGMPNARERRIEKISSQQAGHYLDPFEAAFRYVDGAVYSAERAKFFGKSDSPEAVASSVGRMIQQSVEAGHLNKDQQDELLGLLQTRAMADMVTMGRKTRTLRQMIHMATLGQFSSALNQIVDLATTAVSHGIGSTVSGARKALHLTSADKRIVMEELGIHDHGEEFKDVGRLARTADKVLTITGFKAMDRLGKETRINAAWGVFQRAAQNPKSEDFKRLEKEYRPVLGDKFDSTMSDLKEGRKSEDARYLLFLDTTKIQPVTLSQMPEQYLKMPNGRIMYTLRTFAVTQTDMFRREVLRKLATPGQRRDGLQSLAKFVVYTTLLNLGKEVVKKLMRGQMISVEDIPDVAIDSMLGLVGLNRYTTTKAWSKPVDTVIDFIAPPLQWIDKSWADIVSGGKNGLSSVRYLPAVGELLYYWAPFGKGFQLSKAQAKTDYRSKLKDLRSEIQYSVQNGDIDQADKLITIYNERRTQGPGDGRQNDLSLDSVYASLERKQRKQEQKEGK